MLKLKKHLFIFLIPLLYNLPAFAEKLAKDDLLDLLAGQFSLYRANQTEALQYLKGPSLKYHSAYLAKKTTQLAFAEKAYNLMLITAKQWAELANSGAAHFYLSLAHAYNEAPIHAFKHMRKAEKRGHPTDFTRLVSINADHLLSQNYYIKQLEAHYPSKNTNYDALIARAFLLIEQGKTDEPVMLAEKALATGNNNPATYGFVSSLFEQLGKTQKAMQVFKEGLIKYPGHHSLRYKYIQLALKHDLSIAQTQLEILNLYFPKDHNVQLELAEVYLQQKAYTRSKGLLHDLLKHNFKLDTVFISLANIAQQQGDLKQAIDYRLKANNYGQNSSNIIKVIQLQGQLHEWKKALALINNHFKHPLTQVEKITLQTLKVRALDELNKNKQAFKLIKKYLQQAPNSHPLLTSKALLIAKHHSLDALLIYMQKALNRSNSPQSLLEDMGEAIAQSPLPKAEQTALLQLMMTFDPNNPELLDSFGKLLYRIGDRENAISYLMRAFDSSPKADTAVKLGEILWHSGDKDGAKHLFNQAKKLTPDDKNLQLTLDRLKVSAIHP